MGMRVARRFRVEGIVCFVMLARAASAADKKVTAGTSDADEGTSHKENGIRLGALAGVGFPRPITIEGVVGVGRAIAVGAEYGFMPDSTIGGVDLTLWSMSGDARIFPFRSPFFLGFRAGHQRFGAGTTASLGALGSVSGTLTVDTWFINPRIGALWMWESWLAVGIEAGVQIPLSSDVSSNLPPNLPSDPRITRAKSTLTTVTDALGTNVLPTFDLLKIGLVL